MTKRTTEGDLLTSLVLETFRLNGVLLEAGNNLIKPFGLTSARGQVMGAIDQEGSPLTVAQIARRMGLSRQAVQRIVRDLEQKEMISFESNRDHKRSSLVVLSPKGATAMRQVMEAQTKWVNELSKGRSQNSIKQALSLMQSVRADLEDSS